jgi:transcriptional regulator with PAS, ATPase and Fis domain
MVSKNHLMQRIFELLPQVANSLSTVLITGESGTGKELLARAIHNAGLRREQPFVAVNCGAIPDTLLESELFGYKAGAFTDAKKDKPGRFAQAEGGTLLLDEVGDISSAMQIKLLRVLQEREYEPLGGTRTEKANVRIIASTNRDLTREMEKGNFRQDLYYRLNVLNINLPPLRERREDVPLLVQHFIERFNVLQGRRVRRCSDRVRALLMRYDYPGNIRELENAIEHAFVLCASEIIQLEDLPQKLLEFAAHGEEQISQFGDPLKNAEAQTIRVVLERNEWNRTLTAQELGISRNTLWRKMKQLQIKPEE